MTTILPRTGTNGVCDSVPTQAQLPKNGNEGSVCLVEDTGSRFFYDAIARAWRPIGTLAFILDIAANGGTLGNIDLGATVPANTIIVGGMLHIVTPFTFDDPGATLALKVQAANDLLVPRGADILTAGLQSLESGEVPAPYVNTHAAAITATIAGGNATAGKAYGFLNVWNSSSS